MIFEDIFDSEESTDPVERHRNLADKHLDLVNQKKELLAAIGNLYRETQHAGDISTGIPEGYLIKRFTEVVVAKHSPFWVRNTSPNLHKFKPMIERLAKLEVRVRRVSKAVGAALTQKMFRDTDERGRGDAIRKYF